MKKKLILYPFSEYAIPFIQLYENFNPECEICKSVVPPCYSHIKDNLGMLCNRSIRRCKGVTESEFEYEEYDQLLVIPYAYSNSEIEKMMHKFIRMALSKGKDVICAIECPESMQNEYKELSESNNCLFRYDYGKELNISAETKYKVLSGFWKSETFIIFVSGLIETKFTFEITLNLVDSFRKEGLRSVALTTDRCGSLFEQICLPSDIQMSSKSVSDQIDLLREYIAQIENDMQTDVIVVQVPTPISYLSKKFHEDQGITAILFSTAMEPDMMVCSIPCQYDNLEIFKQLYKDVFNRHRCNLECFSVSNFMVNTRMSEYKRKVVGTFLPKKYNNEVDKLKEGNGWMVGNLMNKQISDEFVGRIVKKYR